MRKLVIILGVILSLSLFFLIPSKTGLEGEWMNSDGEVLNFNSRSVERSQLYDLDSEKYDYEVSGDMIRMGNSDYGYNVVSNTLNLVDVDTGECRTYYSDDYMQEEIAYSLLDRGVE